VVPDNMDALEWLRTHLEAEGSDLPREMVRTFAERLMSAEVEVLCNAGYAEVTPERTNSRNGYRSRQLDTRVGSVDLSIPSCARAATSRAGCSNRAGGQSGRSWRWWPSAGLGPSRRPTRTARPAIPHKVVKPWDDGGAGRPQGVLTSVISGCSLAISRIRNFWTFPEMVIGNSSMNWT
jgi:Transposase, Mutator family